MENRLQTAELELEGGVMGAFTTGTAGVGTIGALFAAIVDLHRDYAAVLRCKFCRLEVLPKSAFTFRLFPKGKSPCFKRRGSLLVVFSRTKHGEHRTAFWAGDGNVLFLLTRPGLTASHATLCDGGKI